MGVAGRGGDRKFLSLAKIAKYLRITYDNWKSGSKFVVHGKSGDIMEFVESDTGLYYYESDVQKKQRHQRGNSFIGHYRREQVMILRKANQKSQTGEKNILDGM